MSVVTLRAGRPEETAALSALAFRAKAHWGYDAEFMEACRAELAVGPDDFTARRLVVAESGGVAAAVAAGHRELRVEADPHAEGFYVGLGARRIGEVPSGSIPGRMLPLLALDL